jgi:protein phosphatase
MSNSQTLKNIYLWVMGNPEINQSPSELIQDRYQVISPNIWLDTKPEEFPSVKDNFAPNLIAYFKLFPKNLYFPYIYSVFNIEETEVVLLENVPISPEGQLYPSLEQVWEEGEQVRQLYWLWQIWELWEVLSSVNGAKSLLIPDNIRVQGSRIRLRELYWDSSAPNLEDLAQSWEDLAKKAKFPLVSPLMDLIKALQEENKDTQGIAKQLNYLLLESAAQQPLRVKIASGTDLGVEPTHNEDSYYPTEEDLPSEQNEVVSLISSQLMMVCDGIEGHEGGEVASQLAISSIKLQIQALLTEIAQEPEIMSPDLVIEQLGAIIRIANNLIASRNDQQEREGRKRMGTTLVMGLQLPQLLGKAESGAGNSHELYIAHIGDSRAYWLTREKCERLTVDHDVATREVRLAHSTYQSALRNPNGSSLTQALGTKEGDNIKPTIQRFIIDEDGILLLCSDGLSDNNFLENHWQNFAEDLLLGKKPIQESVQSLLNQAKTYNTHDNLSVVVAVYGVSTQPPVLVNLNEIIPQPQENIVIPSVDVMINSQSLVISSIEEKGELLADNTMDAEIISEEEIPPEDKPKSSLALWSKIIFVMVGSISLLLLIAVIIIFIQWLINPQQVNELRDRIFNNSSPNSEEIN